MREEGKIEEDGHLIEEAKEEKKDLIKGKIIEKKNLKRKKVLNLKKNLKIINYLKKRENFQNEEEILGINFTRLLHDFAHPIDQPLDLTCHQFVETLV